MEKLKVNKNNLNLLKVNYAKALEDDTFKTLVDSLELASEKKMKYTTRLQEASFEINNCSNCSSFILFSFLFHSLSSHLGFFSFSPTDLPILSIFYHFQPIGLIIVIILFICLFFCCISSFLFLFLHFFSFLQKLYFLDNNRF